MSISLDDLNQRLLSLDLLDLDKIRVVETSFGTKLFTADQFLQQAQRYGFLTKFQVDRLLSGETTGFYYGTYKVQYLIGAGSFARVFRCVRKETGKVVAVKVLRARFRDDKTAVDEFVREGEVGMQLKHPNIAQVYESHYVKPEHFMVMEFIEGSTLREMLAAQKNGYLDPKRAIGVTLDICNALGYAQNRGFQHRDMKPSNIMVASSGRAVLLDFGLLHDDSSDFKTQRAIDYAALERSTHVRRDDPRSDLYFLGAVFYQALSGVAPLGEIKERSRRLDAGRFKNVKPIREIAKHVPPAVAAVVDKSLKFRPEERYQNAESFKKDLERIFAQPSQDWQATQTAQTQKKQQTQTTQPTKTIMVVENDGDFQAMFRKYFKNAGFRPLIISNPKLALQRLEDFEVDAVLFSARALGKNAVIAFNQMLDNPITKSVPAVLLLDENQIKWGASAKRSKTRLAVGMPISMMRLLRVIEKLTGGDENEEKKKSEEETQKVTPSVNEKESRAVNAQGADNSNKVAEESAEDDFATDAYDEALDRAFDTFALKRNGKSEPERAEEKTKDSDSDFQQVKFVDADDDSYVDDSDLEEDE